MSLAILESLIERFSTGTGNDRANPKESRRTSSSQSPTLRANTSPTQSPCSPSLSPTQSPCSPSPSPTQSPPSSPSLSPFPSISPLNYFQFCRSQLLKSFDVCNYFFLSIAMLILYKTVKG